MIAQSKSHSQSRRLASKDHSRNLLRHSSISAAYKMIPKAFSRLGFGQIIHPDADFSPFCATRRTTAASQPLRFNSFQAPLAKPHPHIKEAACTSITE